MECLDRFPFSNRNKISKSPIKLKNNIVQYDLHFICAFDIFSALFNPENPPVYRTIVAHKVTDVWGPEHSRVREHCIVQEFLPFRGY